MTKLYKFFPILFALHGCGSQDYGDPDVAEAVKESEAPYIWEEAVENSRLLSLKPVRGPSTKKGLASSGLTEVAGCPTDSICLRNPYIGPKQLIGLATINPLFDLVTKDDNVVLTYTGPGVLYIEAEIVEIPGNMTLKSCAEKTVLSAREIQGTGSVHTNSTLCPSVKAGDLVVAALTIERLSLDSSGRDGISGVSADSNEVSQKAKDGVPSKVKYSVNWGTSFQGKLCITELACHWDGNPHPDQKFKENMDLIRRAKFIEMDKLESFVKESSNDGRHWWCWVENREEDDFYKHLYFDWKITADFSALKGEDATVFRSGGDGGDGGDAGEIAIVALDNEIEELNSLRGEPGKSGENFSQQPGLGAKLANTSFETDDVVWGGKAYCLRKDKFLNGDPRLIMGREFTFGGRKKISFKVGKDYESPAEGSKLLGHQLEKRSDGYYGADGSLTYSARSPMTGTAGKDIAPRLRIMANLDEYKEAAEDEIGAGSLPKSITHELEDGH